MPKKTDQFRIRGAEPVNHTVGSLRSLTGAMDQLVGHSRRETGISSGSSRSVGSAEAFDESSQRFKDNMKNASIITIDDNVVWDASRDVAMKEDDPTEWDQATRKRFSSAQEQFKKFSGMQLSEVEFHTRALEKLNQDSIEAVRWMMNSNYKFKGKAFNFAFESAPTRNSHLELKRKGHLFALHYTTSVFCVFTDSHFYELTTTGELREIPSATSTTNGFDSRLRTTPFLLFGLEENCFFELKDTAQRRRHAPFDERLDRGRYALYDKVNDEFYMFTGNGVLKKIPSPDRKFLLFDRKKKVFSDEAPDILNVIDPRVEAGHFALYDLGLDKFFEYSPQDGISKIEAPYSSSGEQYLFFDQVNKRLSTPKVGGVSKPELIFALKDPKLLDSQFVLYDPDKDKFFIFESEIENLKEIDVVLTKSELAELDMEKSMLLRQNDVAIEVELRELPSLGEVLDAAKECTPKVVLDYDVEAIATVDLVATLDMRLADRANAMIEVEISTNSNQELLVYIGSNYAPEIIRVENVASARVPERIARGSDTEEITHKLSQSQISIGTALERIKNASEKDFDSLLSSVIQLFNEVIRSQLCRKRLQDDVGMPTNVPTTLQEWVEKNLRGGEDFTDLVAMAESELERVFFARKPEEIVAFIKVLSGKVALQTQEAALFVAKNASALTGQGGYFVVEDILRSSAFVMLTAMEVVRKALDVVQNRKKISIIGRVNTEVKPVTHVDDVPDFFIGYLQRVFRNKLDNNPFQERLHAVDCVLVASQQFADLLPLPVHVDQSSDEEEGVEVEVENSYRGPTETRLLSVTVPRYREVLQLAKLEKIAALAVRNPVIQGVMDTSVPFSLKQWLSLYPATAPAFPYFVLLEMAASTGGIIVARHAILHPTDRQNRAMRYWKAGTDGLVITVFTMGTAINIYLALNPKNTHISNLEFWSQLAPAPIVIAAGYTVWGAIAPSAKERWFRRRPGIRSGLEVGAKFAYYGGVLEMSMLNIVNSPGNLLYVGLPLIPALGFSLLHLNRFRETGNAIMSYLAAINFAYMIGRDLEAYQLNEEPETDWTYYTRIGYWSLALSYSIYFMARHSTRFVRRYQGDPEFVVQDGVPVGTTEFDSDRHPVVPERIRAQMSRGPSTPDERQALITYSYQMQRARTDSEGSDDLEAANRPIESRRKWCTIV